MLIQGKVVVVTMEYRNSHLCKFIEEMRKELNRLGDRKPLTDPEVVKLSQRLDELLNKYWKLQYNKSQENAAK